MKNLSTIVKALLKPVALVKYVCFPFLMAQSQQAIDFSKIVHSSSIMAKVETSESVWLATDNGLYQINKTNGKYAHLTTENSVLPSNHIKGICVTANENVYAATDNGIFRFDGVSYLTISTENANLPTNHFTSIACDESGRIFLGTTNYGIVMMKNYKCHIFNTHNSVLTTNSVNKVYCNENGIIISELANGYYAAMGNSTMVLIKGNQTDYSDALAKRN